MKERGKSKKMKTLWVILLDGTGRDVKGSRQLQKLTSIDEWNDSSIDTQLTRRHLITGDGHDRTARPVRRQPLGAPSPHTHTQWKLEHQRR